MDEDIFKIMKITRHSYIIWSMEKNPAYSSIIIDPLGELGEFRILRINFLINFFNLHNKSNGYMEKFFESLLV